MLLKVRQFNDASSKCLETDEVQAWEHAGFCDPQSLTLQSPMRPGFFNPDYSTPSLKPNADAIRTKRFILPEESEVLQQERAQNDLIISCSLFLPRKPRSNHTKIATTFQIQFKASSPLSILRESFFCPSDLIKIGNISSASSYIFCESIFYTHVPEGEMDPSQTVIDWAVESSTSEFKQRPMASTTFMDLNFRLNHPYLYLHQGDCGHSLVFNNIRRMNKRDANIVYPLVTNAANFLPQQCTICETCPPVWLTYDDKLADVDPCLFCETCFAEFHAESPLGSYKLMSYESTF